MTETSMIDPQLSKGAEEIAGEDATVSSSVVDNTTSIKPANQDKILDTHITLREYQLGGHRKYYRDLAKLIGDESDDGADSDAAQEDESYESEDEGNAPGSGDDFIDDASENEKPKKRKCPTTFRSPVKSVVSPTRKRSGNGMPTKINDRILSTTRGKSEYSNLKDKFGLGGNAKKNGHVAKKVKVAYH